MMYLILILVGFVAGLLSGSVGFGGGMILKSCRRQKMKEYGTDNGTE